MTSVTSPPKLQRTVLNLVREEVLQTPPGFDVESDLFEAGLDSMAIMQLLLLMEERFAVSIPVGSVSRANFKSASTIAALLIEQGYQYVDHDVSGADEAFPETVTSAAVEVAPAPVLEKKEPVEEKPLDRVPLRDCDFFTHAFDLMLRDNGQGGHIAHSFLELDKTPNVTALREVIASLGSRYPFPIFTARLGKKSFFSLPEWIPATNPATLDLNLWSQQGSAGTLLAQGGKAFEDLQTQLEDIVNESLPQEGDSWINARFDLVEKREGGCIFVFSWSHLIMDGVGAEYFLQELNRLMGGKGEPVPAFDFSDNDPSRGWGARWRPAMEMPKIFDEILAKPFEALGSPRLTKGRANFQVITLTEEQTAEAARRSAQISGPLINMPFHLACAMRAHYRVMKHRGMKPESLMCCIPIQVRRKGTRGPLFQNHLTMFFCALSAEELETLDSAAKSLHEQHTRFIKEKIGDAFRDLMWMMRPMPPKLHMQFINWQMKGKFSSFYHSNTGVFAPELTEFAGAAVTNAYHVPGFSNPPGTGVFANEKNGRLVLTLCWRETILSEEEREVFIQQLMEDVGVR